MNIYVGNLAYGISEDELRSAFEEYGTVNSASIITDKYSGRSKGFGFIEMPDDSEAKAAIEGLNGKELAGRAINVNEAQPRTERRPSRFGGGGGGYGGGGGRSGGSGGGRGGRSGGGGGRGRY